MARAARALQEGRDRARRSELAHEVDVADVDAELERGGGDEDLELAVLQPLLGLEPQLLGHAAVMRHHAIGAEELGQMPRRALGHPARVDEDERRAVVLRELPRAARRPAPRPRATSPLRAATDGTASARSRGRTWPVSTIAHCRAFALRARSGDRRPGSARSRRSAFASRKARCAPSGLPVSASSRSSDSARWLPRLLPASAWISSTITVRVVASILRPDSEPSSTYSDSGVVTTMCGGRLRMPSALALRRVAGAHERADVDVRQPERLELAADSGERRSEIAADVVRQRLERRDVDDLRLVGQRRPDALADQSIDRRQERGKRLARARGRGDQDVLSAAGSAATPPPEASSARGSFRLNQRATAG